VAVIFLIIGYFLGTSDIVANINSTEIKPAESDTDAAESEVNINNNSLNQILINSGLLNKNIYSPDKDVAELALARDKKFEIPDDYELAIDTKYNVNDTSYTIKTLRQIDNPPKPEDIEPLGYFDSFSRMPKKPLIIAVVKDDDVIVNLFIVNRFSVLEGNEGWGDYDKAKVTKAVELKDLDGDDISEILVYTFKGYTADSENGMVTLYFDKQKNTFTFADKIFKTTWKEAYDLVDINKKFYIVEANSGSGNCRVCPTPYIVRIYQFTGDYFFDIGSVGVEKEYDDGSSALKNALPRVKNKILTGDVFTL